LANPGKRKTQFVGNPERVLQTPIVKPFQGLGDLLIITQGSPTSGEPWAMEFNAVGVILEYEHSA
jgi:hypothetical protein